MSDGRGGIDGLAGIGRLVGGNPAADDATGTDPDTAGAAPAHTAPGDTAASADPRKEILAGLLEIVTAATGVPQERIEETADIDRDLAVDSLSKVEIAVRAEDRFGVRMDDSAISTFTTLRDVVDYVLAHR